MAVKQTVMQKKGKPQPHAGKHHKFRTTAQLAADAAGETRQEARKSKLGHQHMSTRLLEMDPGLAAKDPDNMSYQCTIWLPRALIWAIDTMTKNNPLKYRNRSHFALIALYKLYQKELTAFSESMEGPVE